MRREVEFRDTELVVKLVGWVRFLALKNEVIIPYLTIKSAYVDYFEPPAWMLRMPGTSISPLHIYEGTFKHRNHWYFLSYEHRVPLVIMVLDGHEYNFVVFEINHPEDIALEIRSHINFSY